MDPDERRSGSRRGGDETGRVRRGEGACGISARAGQIRLWKGELMDRESCCTKGRTVVALQEIMMSGSGVVVMDESSGGNKDCTRLSKKECCCGKKVRGSEDEKTWRRLTCHLRQPHLAPRWSGLKSRLRLLTTSIIRAAYVSSGRFVGRMLKSW